MVAHGSMVTVSSSLFSTGGRVPLWVRCYNYLAPRPLSRLGLGMAEESVLRTELAVARYNLATTAIYGLAGLGAAAGLWWGWKAFSGLVENQVGKGAVVAERAATAVAATTAAVATGGYQSLNGLKNLATGLAWRLTPRTVGYLGQPDPLGLWLHRAENMVFGPGNFFGHVVDGRNFHLSLLLSAVEN